eukprot:194900_1
MAARPSTVEIAASWVAFTIELCLLALWLAVAVFKCAIVSTTPPDKDRQSVKSKTGDAPSMNSGNAKSKSKSSGASGTNKVVLEIHDYDDKNNASSEETKPVGSDQTIENIHNEQQAINISLSFQILVGLSILWGVICNVVPLINYYGDLHSHTSYCVIVSLPTMFLSRFFMAWFFVERLRQSFMDTPLAYSDRTIKCIKIALFASYPLVICFYFIFRVAVQCDPNKRMIAIALTVLNDFGWSIVLLYLFVKKLKQLLRFNETIKELRYLVTKQTILVCVAIGSTIVLLFLFAATRVVQTVFVDMVINSTCLVLSFMFADRYYRKMCILCRKCTVNG